MDAAFLASVALDGGRVVDDLKLRSIGGDGKRVSRYDADDAEEGPRWFPAFRAATCVIVGDVRGELNLDGRAGATAVQLSTGEIGLALGQAIIDAGMKGWHVGQTMFCGGTNVQRIDYVR